MARKRLIRTSEFPYHVTIRSNNKDWFDIPMDVLWSISQQALARAAFKYPVKIEAFVLMNNHYHLLLYTPNSDLDVFMHILNSSLSKGIRSRTGRINRVFGDRYKWSLIQTDRYYRNVVRYIFQNPVRAGLTKKCEDYKFSTLYYQVKKMRLPVKLPERFCDKNYLSEFNTIIDSEKCQEFKREIRSSGVL